MRSTAVLILLAATITVTSTETGSNETTNEDVAALGCLLADAKPSCAFGGVLPKRLVEFYRDLSTQTKVAILYGDFASLSPEDIVQLPAPLVYLLPLPLMKTLSGSALAVLLQKHRRDVAMAVKIIQAVERPEERLKFLDVLIGTELPIETQHLLGDALLSWWPNIASGGDKEEEQMLQAIRNGSPLLSYLPASTIRQFHGKLAEKFLFRLRARNLSILRPWSGNSRLVRRVWAELVFKEIYPRWGPKEVKGFEFLISGATPSEIHNLTKEQLDQRDNVLSATPFDKLQARALFSVLYGDEVLTNANLTELLPIVMQLAPHELQHFAINATDFRNKSITPDLRRSSFATDKQIGELLIAQAVLDKRLSSKDPEVMQDKIQVLGQFAYTLPSHVFQLHRDVPARQWSNFLTSIDSNKLSRKQACLVTIQGTFLSLTTPSSVLGLRGQLKAIRTWQLVHFQTGELPHNVLIYLAASLPNFEPALSADLLHKLRPELDEDSILENLLVNEDSNQFFSLLSSREIQMRSNEMFASLKSLWNSFQTKIEKMPQSLLSVLLQSTRIRTSGNWKADELTQHIAFMGLSCNIIDKTELFDAIDILSQYNGKLRTLHRSFPKNLQFCCQQLVYRYLQEKAAIRQVNIHGNILNLLEPAEIQAIGGYILTSIPPPLVERVMYHREILHVIGQQPLPDLWEASGQKIYLNTYAQLALESLVDVHSEFLLELSELLSLGSLVHFLPAKTIERIKPADFKFYLEALDDTRSKTLCAGMEDRKAWYELIKLAFGSPSSWTETTLSTLGDWLVAVPNEVLGKVPSKRWTAVIDDLAEKTSYHLELRWPGNVKPVMFFKVCLEVLNSDEHQSYETSVKSLLNRYLIASQSQLDTIVSSHQLVVSTRESNKVVTMEGVKIFKEATEIEVIQPREPMAKPTKEAHVEIHTISPTTAAYFTTLVTEDVDHPTTSRDFVDTSTVLEETTTSPTRPTTQIIDAFPSTTENMSTTEVTLALPDVTIGTLLRKTTPEMTDAENSGTMESTVADSSTSHDKKDRLKRSLLREGGGSLKVKPLLRTSNNLKEKRKGSTVETSITSRARKIQNDNRTRRKISCDAIRALGQSASLALQKFDIDQMTTDELVNCLEVLGTLQLPHVMFMQIWRRVKSANKTLLVSELVYLGHLVQAIEKEDVDKLDLSLGMPDTLDTLAVLGREVRHGRLLEALGERFILNNTGVSNIGPGPLIALGRIICELPLNTVRNLMGLSFLHVVTPFGQVLSVYDALECPISCLDNLARLAMEDNAFGPPNTWSAEDITSLGVISAGLLAQKWQLVNASAMHGLTPSAVKCIAPQVFKEFSTAQLLHFSPLAAAMVSPEQLSQLSDDQRSAVTQVRDLQPIASLQHHHGNTNAVTSSGTTAIGMNVCFRDRQLFLKYFRNELYVVIYMLICGALIINATGGFPSD